MNKFIPDNIFYLTFHDNHLDFNASSILVEATEKSDSKLETGFIKLTDGSIQVRELGSFRPVMSDGATLVDE